MKRHMLSLAAGLVLLAGVAQAEILTTIDLSQPSKVTILPPGQQVIVRLNNPTKETQTFTSPTLKMSVKVEPNSTKDIQVKAEDVPGRFMVYNTLGQQQITTATNSSSESYKNISVKSIINYNTNYTADSKSEPRYYTEAAPKAVRKAAAHEKTVRGYW
jgi:adenine deaminase